MRTAPLVSRWIRAPAGRARPPPLTVAQYLALQAIAEGEVVGAELARRAAVSPAAVSQLLATLEESGLLARGPSRGRPSPPILGADRARAAGLTLGSSGRSATG